VRQPKKLRYSFLNSYARPFLLSGNCRQTVKEYLMANQNTQNQGSDDGKSNRGFANMDEEKQREIASKGGQMSHERGTAHEFDSEEASRAGQKGGEAESQDREHLAEIGAEGGRAHGTQSASGQGSNQEGRSTQGGTTEQHAKAGSQSHQSE
jgi:general stress protein YciG